MSDTKLTILFEIVLIRKRIILPTTENIMYKVVGILLFRF